MIDTRQKLIEYALRKLGAPVINIEVDMTQVQDRVDDALQFFQDFHYDATERVWLKHVITGTEITMSTSGLQKGDKVTAANGNYFIVDDMKTPTIAITNGVFSPIGASGQSLVLNETLTNQTGFTTTFLLKVQGDTENGYVSVSPLVTGVIRAVPWTPNYSSQNFLFDPMFNLTSQLSTLGSSSLIYYEQVREYMELVDKTIRPLPQINFNQKMNRIYLDTDMSGFTIGTTIVFETYRILDPDTYVKIYNDRLLKKLVTAVIKKQWASNTSKYQNIQLLGGVTIDASTLMAQAEAEIQSAENEIRDTYELPPIGFLG